MGRGVLDVPLQDLAEFVKGVENNMAWDDLLVVRLKNCIPYVLYIAMCVFE